MHGRELSGILAGYFFRLFDRAWRLQAKTVFSLNGIQRLVEVGLIVFIGLSAFMLLALLSFDPADPSWSQTGYHTDVRNFAGPVGARTADILFAVFGWLSYLFPPFFAFCGYLLFKRFKDLISIDYLILGLRLLGLLVTVSTACAISSINFDDFFIYSSGGVVGDVIVGILLPNLNFVGSSLLLLCGFCMGLTMLTGISWLTVADELGRFVMDCYHFLRQLPARFRPEPQLAFPGTTEVPAAKAVARSKDKIPAYDAVAEFAADESDTQKVAASNKVQVIAPVQERKEPAFSFDMREMVEPTFDMASLSTEQGTATGTDDNSPEDHSQGNVRTAETNLALNKPVQSSSGVSTPTGVAEHGVIKVDPMLQSRAFFPAADALVEPLPFQPLDANTDARAFLSVDELAEDELSYSAIDDRYDAADLQQGLAHTQSPYAPPVTYEEPPFELDEEDEPTVLGGAQPASLAELLPALSLLDRPNKTVNPISQEDLDKVSRLVELKLLDFSVDAKVVGVYPGPVVTRFELDLAPGVKVSKITGLSKDLARSLSAISVRVVEVIPGKSFIGLELPNQHREIVRLSEVIGDEVFEQSKSPLTMVLGKDIAGKSVVADLAKMPHLLVAGTTGSGKSVGVNVMICSLLYKSTPDEVRFLMIDPKMLELSVYEGIPHLLTEVVTDMKEAANGLRWCVGEMERRYKLMSALGVRNLKGYNVKVMDAIAEGKPLRDPLWRPSEDMRNEPPLLEKLPSIVVVIDEFADMMMIVGKKVEELIARIAQKARAAGIHLILATQRPSVDVITGLIKANIPTRIAFQVSSKIDSRTILDQQGAESLLGQGDMLYLPPGSGVPNRVHGAFVDDHEVHAVVADWKKRGRPNYIPEILNGETTEENLLPGETLEDEDAEADPLFDQAVAFVTESRKASVSGVQRRFRIGYNRAARLVETMEQIGIVSGPGHNGNREVLAPPPPKGF